MLRMVPLPHFMGEEEAGAPILPREAGEGDRAKRGGGGAPRPPAETANGPAAARAGYATAACFFGAP